MELDGLTSNFTPQLTDAAAATINYLASRIRSHAVSRRVQIFKGNYLSSLNVRTEDVSFDLDGMSNEKMREDLILQAVVWQDDHRDDKSTTVMLSLFLQLRLPTPSGRYSSVSIGSVC